MKRLNNTALKQIKVEEMINAPIHGNFFENRVTDYAKGATSGSWSDVWGKA